MRRPHYTPIDPALLENLTTFPAPHGLKEISKNLQAEGDPEPNGLLLKSITLGEYHKVLAYLKVLFTDRDTGMQIAVFLAEQDMVTFFNTSDFAAVLSRDASGLMIQCHVEFTTPAGDSMVSGSMLSNYIDRFDVELINEDCGIQHVLLHARNYQETEDEHP